MARPKPLNPWHTNPLTLRTTWEQRVKLKQLGGAVWLRQQIDQAQIQFKLEDNIIAKPSSLGTQWNAG
jgi:hypothetical protein